MSAVPCPYGGFDPTRERKPRVPRFPLGRRKAAPAEVRRTVSESVLVQVAAGDADAMRRCIDRYSGLVWRLAWRMLPDRSDVDEAVQEVFISLWENADRFTTDFGEETTFVAMIARRRLIDRGRRILHQRRTRERAAERAAAGTDQPGVRSIVGASGRDPVEPTADAEALARVREAMRELPERQRQVLELSLRGDCSHSELATQLGLPLGTVKTLIRRGMIRLRELVERTDAPGADAIVERSA